MIEYPISLILVNTIYNTLHTVFSTNSFYGCRAVAHLIAPLYERYSTIISETPTPDLEPFRIISSSALKELRSIFFQLCNDDRLLVRREAAKQFSTCLHAFGSQYYSQFVQLLRTFVSDDVFWCSRGVDPLEFGCVRCRSFVPIPFSVRSSALTT